MTAEALPTTPTLPKGAIRLDWVQFLQPVYSANARDLTPRAKFSAGGGTGIGRVDVIWYEPANKLVRVHSQGRTLSYGLPWFGQESA